MRVLVTGAAGFIGFHVAKALIDRGDEVIGHDNLNDFYDPALKQARLDELLPRQGFSFVKGDLADRTGMERLFSDTRPDAVVHLAAQAGVRYSIDNPHVYASSNLTGFLHVLEGCRAHAVRHLVYASSSSVYGADAKVPFSVDQPADHPISLYAATKRSNELMAHVYAHLFRIPVTGLRFFTVYGPWGRPDMAPFKFTQAILAGKPIEVYNHGRMSRDFTYIDDITTGVVRVLDRPPPEGGEAPFRLYNIGNHEPVALMDFIAAIERATGHVAQKVFRPMQPGDVPTTFADVASLMRDVGFAPSTPLQVGIERFVSWYRRFYGC
jgi:UDP-glucuronate 4-epimerase